MSVNHRSLSNVHRELMCFRDRLSRSLGCICLSSDVQGSGDKKPAVFMPKSFYVQRHAPVKTLSDPEIPAVTRIKKQNDPELLAVTRIKTQDSPELLAVIRVRTQNDLIIPAVMRISVEKVSMKGDGKRK